MKILAAALVVGLLYLFCGESLARATEREATRA